MLEAPALARLGDFLDLLDTWNRRIHLTGDRERHLILGRHLVDSLAPARHLPASGLVIDVGSGAGFPGIVLACVRPDVALALIDSRRRRISFLREVIRTLALPQARAFELRAEEARREPELAARGDVVIARALRVDEFLALAAPLLAPSGVAIAMQTPGRQRAAEAAGESYRLPLQRVVSYEPSPGRRRSLLFFARPGGSDSPVS